MSFIRISFILFIPLVFSSCTTIAENIGWTGLVVLSLILLVIFGLMFYFIIKRRRQADKSLAQFNLSVLTMLNKLDSTEKKIKSLEVLIKRINEDEAYKKDTQWRDQVLAKTYLHMATQYFNTNNTQKTLEYCSKILELTPDDAMTLYNRGSIYSNAGKFEEALADLNRSIELVSDYPSSYNNRGMILSRLEKYEEALEDFNKAIDLEETAVAFFNRGITYKVMGNKEMALRDYEKALILCDEIDNEELREEIIKTKSEL